MDTYEKRVRAYEAKGCTRSDAQAVVDAEDKNKGKHTPGPWTMELKDSSFYLYPAIGRGSHLYPIATGKINSDENAAFIVTACNSHYELLEACKAMLSWHEAHYTELMPIDTHFNKNSMLNKARRVIEKAEGK